MCIIALEDLLDLRKFIDEEDFTSFDFSEFGETPICPALHVRA